MRDRWRGAQTEDTRRAEAPLQLVRGKRRYDIDRYSKQADDRVAHDAKMRGDIARNVCKFGA